MDIEKIEKLEIYLDTTLKYKRLKKEEIEILFYIKYKFQKYGEGRAVLKFLEEKKRKELEKTYYENPKSQYVKNKEVLKLLKSNEYKKALTILDEILKENFSEEVKEVRKAVWRRWILKKLRIKN